jgi:RNA polymerase sigma-70 factor (ECF subfamily)
VKVVPTSVSSSPEQAVRPHEAAELDDLLAPLMLPAYRLAFGMLRNREEAEDAVQDAALSAWKHRKRFRAGADPKPWFFAIVANRCRSTRRSPWSRLLRQASPVPQSAPAPDVDSNLDLRRAVNRLRHDDRLALVLRFYLDLPYEEIAAVLRISEAAARSRAQRAVRRLRPELSQSEELTW